MTHNDTTSLRGDLVPEHVVRHIAAVEAWDKQVKIRPLRDIAQEIKQDWTRVYFGAAPYLDAMSDLNAISDKFYSDDGASIVRYFLSNATTWKGETARRVKAELKAMLKR